MLIAQVSDLHISRRQSPLSEFVDTDRTLQAVIATLNTLQPRPDVVLFTGDLTDNGDPAEYAALHELLEPLELRYLLLTGNHDSIPELCRQFPEHALPDDSAAHFSYVVDDLPVRLVGLDTTVPGEEYGNFDEPRSAWLAAALAGSPDQATLIFMHHPPFETGLRWMDLTTLRGADRFAELLGVNSQVKLVVAGHVHRPVQTVIGGTLVSICPSTAFQIGLKLDPAEAQVTDQPPSYQLHIWDGQGFVTHTAPVWDGRDIDLSSYARQLEAEAAQAG